MRPYQGEGGVMDLLTEIERDLVSGAPLADVLRKCVLLGGQAGSVPLRDWATRELRGYGPEDQVPAYRTRGVTLCIDAVTPRGIIRGQQISRGDLPDYAQDSIGEEYTFREGVGELEAMVPEGQESVKLTFTRASDVANVMDAEAGVPFQQITAIYWKVSRATVDAVLDQVRTSLTELVAEMRAGVRKKGEEPSAQLANQAVSVVIGDANRVVINTATSGEGPVSITSANDSSTAAQAQGAGSASAGENVVSGVTADQGSSASISAGGGPSSAGASGAHVGLRDRIRAWSITKKVLTGVAGAASISGFGLAIYQIFLY